MVVDGQLDPRDAVRYLVAPEADEYIAIMEVLETSVTDVAPREVGTALRGRSISLDEVTIEGRLEQLREWGAVSKRADATRFLRVADLLARNYRYTASPAGRHVQRFYRTVLAETHVAREIPLASLARVVDTAERLADAAQLDAGLISRLFVDHDDLDGGLVGAEDTLASLADRFDLGAEDTAELKTMLVQYATHVALELEHGSARVYRALASLRPQFESMAALAVAGSNARDLIKRGALTASRGGRVADWDGLLTWFDPERGRATRFAIRLVRALPGMHVNIRRLHSSAGTTTSRSRLLALAKACRDPDHGPSIMLAALGDHPWRKLYAVAEDDEGGALPWAEGPRVEVPELLRLTGRGGARGRPPAARDDGPARAAVQAERARRAQARADAIEEVLRMEHGAAMSDQAGRLALAALMAAARTAASERRRRGVQDGLACTLFDTPGTNGRLVAVAWYVLTPGRTPIFHRPGSTPPWSPIGEPP